MGLIELGYDDWFEQKRGEIRRPDCEVAKITRVDRDRYLVLNGETEVRGEPTGKLLFSADSGQDLPCVGDWVLVQYHNDGELAIIHAVLPRKSYLRRKSSGQNVDYQMIASNIDRALIVQSCDFNFNIRRLERYLVITNEGGIEPTILLSKSDLVSPADLESMIAAIEEAHIGAPIIPLSNLTPDGLDSFRAILERGKTYCLLGSSGVGKTTLLNSLAGKEIFETNPVREKDSRGRHTTARRQLVVLGNGSLLVDTPGMRELGLIGAEESIDNSFSDIHELSESCRFADCTHTHETDCAVVAALEAGTLDEERYQNYKKLLKESAYHQMTYAEKRKKDKQFGRMIKKAMKLVKKK
ncbi:MAG TPA: ribosome small subunit-dependent GTPase A [Bacteroidetes bacterium]|nr:ribosome small subunit-dependent GTPase A [Bacteroidota bacterium]